VNSDVTVTRMYPSRRGAWLVAAIFVFGGVVFCGLYFAPRNGPPPAPAGARPGVPARNLRFVTWDLRRRHPGASPAFDVVRRLNADYLLLQNIEEEDVIPLAEAVGMQHSYHPQLYQRARNFAGRKAEWGACVLSKYPLYEGLGIPGPHGASGTWAVSVVDGRKFMVAVAHFVEGEEGRQEAASLRQAWEQKDSPPMVLSMLPADGSLPPVIQSVTSGPSADGQWMLFTKDWKHFTSKTGDVATGGPLPIVGDFRP
jgi:hypothetical protein